MDKPSDLLKQILDENLKLEKRFPDEIHAFTNFMKKAESGPILSHKEKELINVALAVAAQCEWCISLHVKYATEAGASRDEIIKSGFQAVLMHGGPALMYLITLLRALDDFQPE